MLGSKVSVREHPRYWWMYISSRFKDILSDYNKVRLWACENPRFLLVQPTDEDNPEKTYSIIKRQVMCTRPLKVLNYRQGYYPATTYKHFGVRFIGVHKVPRFLTSLEGVRLFEIPKYAKRNFFPPPTGLRTLRLTYRKKDVVVNIPTLFHPFLIDYERVRLYYTGDQIWIVPEDNTIDNRVKKFVLERKRQGNPQKIVFSKSLKIQKGYAWKSKADRPRQIRVTIPAVLRSRVFPITNVRCMWSKNLNGLILLLERRGLENWMEW